jgi:regulator of sigma E protease
MTWTIVTGMAGLGSLALAPQQVVGYLKTGFWFVVVVGVLVFVHEVGHFLVAKWAGVGVLKFSLGFGPKIVGLRRGETEYLISAIPLGGYVKMVGEDPADQTADPARSFQNKSVGWRTLVVLAGPGANVVLAVVFFAVLALAQGQPVRAPFVGSVEPGSAAERAGLRPGDLVLAVDGAPVGQWDDVQSRLEEAKGRPLLFRVQRGTEHREVTVTVAAEPRERQEYPPKVGMVMAGEAGERAGVKAGDKVVAFDGVPTEVWSDLVRLVRRSPGKAARLTVERGGQQVDLPVTPAIRPNETGTGQIGYLGIGPDEVQEPVTVRREEWSLGVGERFESMPVHRALYFGVRQTWLVGGMTLRVLGRLLTGDLATSKAIGGPLFIAREAGRQAQQGGLPKVVFLTAVLSVNLAILNLLPVPILDGGHLLFFAIEAARRSPLSLRKREIAQQVGLALLAALMVFAFYNDIFRLLGRP